MSEIIILVLFLFFAVCGVSTISAKLWLFLVRPHKKRNSVLIVNINEDENDENLLFAIEKYRWYGSEYADYIVFVTNSKISEKASCRLAEYKNIFCVKEENLLQLLKKIEGGRV